MKLISTWFAEFYIPNSASQQHKSDEALSKFRSAAKLHPNDSLNQYLLAEALSERGPSEGSTEYQEELAAARRASKLDPSLTAAHDLLAGIYLQSGHPDLATEESRASLAIDPKDQQALYHLILSLRKNGARDELSSLLKQLEKLRDETKAASAEDKRYRLEEVPAGNVK
jgi:tetratricopeptide (TPR) repeat protein